GCGWTELSTTGRLFDDALARGQTWTPHAAGAATGNLADRFLHPEDASRTARRLVDTAAARARSAWPVSGERKGGEMEGHTDAPCPNCDNPVIDKPRAGGATVCLNCGAWLVPAGEP